MAVVQWAFFCKEYTHGGIASTFSLTKYRGRKHISRRIKASTQQSGGSLRGWAEIEGEVADAIEQGDFAYAKRAVYEDDGVLSRSSRDDLLKQIRKAEAENGSATAV